MRLEDCATIRTGLVLSRKEASSIESDETFKNKALNLKAVTAAGEILPSLFDDYYAIEKLKLEYFTHENDVIVRLSSPYTATLITAELEGILIPSHFAIIRPDIKKIVPKYLCWLLNRENMKNRIAKNISGSAILGTISSGFFAGLTLKDIPIEKQHQIAEITKLSESECKLINKLIEQKEILTRQATEQIYRGTKRGNGI